MIYNYSICHPDKPKIEYPENTLNVSQVTDFIKSYPWLDILKSMEEISEDQIYYSPSLDFKEMDKKRSLGITATLENGQPEFSLWYNRPVKRRPFFGLVGEKTKMEVIDKWGFTLEKAMQYYDLFLGRNYQRLESLMTKN